MTFKHSPVALANGEEELAVNLHRRNATRQMIYSSVGIALGYGPDDWGSRFRFPAAAGDLSLHYRIQNGSRAHPASYPMGTRGSFPWVKAAGS
jgi:hypothetical protein